MSKGGSLGCGAVSECVQIVTALWLGLLAPAWAGLRETVSPKLNIEDFEPVEARHVRFTIFETNGGDPQLDEVEVYSAGGDSRNVALGAKATSPVDRPTKTTSLENLTDGKHGCEQSWLAGPPNNVARMEQRVDVNAFKESIDAGEAETTLSGLLGGWYDKKDAARIGAVFRDIDGGELGEAIEIGPVTLWDRADVSCLLPRQTRAPIPRGTRSIQVVVTAEGDPNGDCDGYVDNVVLALFRRGVLAPLATNLLENPDAELGGPVPADNAAPPKGWTRLEGNFTVTPYLGQGGTMTTNYARTIQGGANFFFGAENNRRQWPVEIELAEPALITRIVWSVDRTGVETLRLPLDYRFEVAREKSAGVGGGWTLVASSENRAPYTGPRNERPPRGRRLPSTFRVHTLDRSSGLPSNLVRGVAQTPEGYVGFPPRAGWADSTARAWRRLTKARSWRPGARILGGCTQTQADGCG